jgi:hypothetical protein
MNAMAALLVCAAGLMAQDGTSTATALTDAELGLLGGYAADQIDGSSDPEALERSILTKIDDIRKAGASGEKKDESPASKGKARKKKNAKKQASAPSDVIKNGLTEADRVALGKFVVSEITNGHPGEALSAALKKELERLRADRVKASSGASETTKKKKMAEN